MGAGSVRLSLSKTFYDLGDRVFGNIHARLDEPLKNEGVEIHSYCIISGGEKAATRPVSMSSGNILAYHHRLDPEGLHPVIHKGDHLWPITFEIPLGVPPSFSGLTRVPFSVVHWVRVVILQKGLFVDGGFDEVFAFQVRAPLAPALYRQLSCGEIKQKQVMEKSFWREGGILGIEAKHLSSVLVPGEFFDVQLDLDMRECKVKLRFVEIRLLQRVENVAGSDSRWTTEPVAKSVSTPTSVNIRPEGQVHSTILQLPVPIGLETTPTMSTPYGGCEYYVMLFICPESGEDVTRSNPVPLLPSSSLIQARIMDGAAGALPVRYSAPPPAGGKLAQDIPPAELASTPPPYYNTEAPLASPPDYSMAPTQ